MATKKDSVASQKVFANERSAPLRKSMVFVVIGNGQNY